jgi:hypothetical protein
MFRRFIEGLAGRLKWLSLVLSCVWGVAWFVGGGYVFVEWLNGWDETSTCLVCREMLILWLVCTSVYGVLAWLSPHVPVSGCSDVAGVDEMPDSVGDAPTVLVEVPETRVMEGVPPSFPPRRAHRRVHQVV